MYCWGCSPTDNRGEEMGSHAAKQTLQSTNRKVGPVAGGRVILFLLMLQKNLLGKRDVLNHGYQSHYVTGTSTEV